MTRSRPNTPMNADRELRESVQELNRLLENLKKTQVNDDNRGSNNRLNQQMYSSSSSLNVTQSHGPGGSNYGSRPRSAASSSTPNHKLSSSSSNKHEVDTYTTTTSTTRHVEQSELEREQEQTDEEEERDTIPRGVFVKDVVEEEILVDHVLIQPPKTQQSDRNKFITRPTDRRQNEHRARRQVAFSDQNLHTTTATTTTDDGSETYDNTDTEEQVTYTKENTNRQLGASRQPRDTQSASMLSLNSATTEQSDTSSILDPSKIINCHTCGERVVGQVITALGRNYHREHFTCAHCNQELGTRNFYERDNLPYCEKDYQALFSPKCAACNEPILDKVTIALDKTFHPEHFVCAHCGCQFDDDDGFHEKDGLPYCKDDFFELFANKCASCQLPITANYITALNVQWHPDCFVCSDCHCPFADGKFFDIDGAPYCEIHYHARRGSLCAVCRQPIIGKCTTAMFRKFHPDHFTCAYCLKVLSKSFKEENDKPYCFECFDKLYS